MKGWLSNYFNKESKYSIAYVSFNSGKEIVYHGCSDVLFSIFCEIKCSQVETIGILPFDSMYFETESEYQNALEMIKEDFEGCEFKNVDELKRIKVQYKLYSYKGENILLSYIEEIIIPKRSNSDFLYGITEYFSSYKEMSNKLKCICEKVYQVKYLYCIDTKKPQNYIDVHKRIVS